MIKNVKFYFKIITSQVFLLEQHDQTQIIIHLR